MRLSNTLFTSILILCTLCASFALAKRSDKEIFDDIRNFDQCLVQASYSFAQTAYNPPRTQQELVRTCKNHADGIKCLKEKSKGSEPLIRRGVVGAANTNSRKDKKICSNPTNDFAKKFLAGSKCLLDKKLPQLRQLDLWLAKNIAAVVQRNYNDSRPELKQMCCIFYKYRKDLLDFAGESCPEHREALDNLIGTMVVEDLTLVCDDNEKLSKSCLNVEKLPIDRIDLNKTLPPTVLALYAFATLGEPSDQPFDFLKTAAK